jgi:hypothetical protein
MSSLGEAKSSLGDAKSSLGDAKSSLGDVESSLGDVESSMGDAKSSLGDAESSLGDAKSSLGDVESSLGDAKSSLDDATSSLGDAESSLGDAESSLGDAESSLGDAKSSLGDALTSRWWTQLNLTTYANGTERSQIVSMVGPKTLSNGEEINTTVFVPIRTFSLDPEVKTFTLTIDQYDQVSETNEQNTYELSFRMCWPADLWPGPSLHLLHPGQAPGQLPIEVRSLRQRRSHARCTVHRTPAGCTRAPRLCNVDTSPH